MALEMKQECEKCHQPLAVNGIAMICSMNALSGRNVPMK
jgi:hypothetical protein